MPLLCSAPLEPAGRGGVSPRASLRSARGYSCWAALRPLIRKPDFIGAGGLTDYIHLQPLPAIPLMALLKTGGVPLYLRLDF